MTASRNPFRRLRWPLLLTYCLALYTLFTLPPEEIPEALAAANDKLIHFLDFFLLALLAFQALFHSAHPFLYGRAGRTAAGFSLFYGAFLEWVQRRVPGREASLTDWAADALGILVASGIFRNSQLTRPA